MRKYNKRTFAIFYV